MTSPKAEATLNPSGPGLLLVFKDLRFVAPARKGFRNLFSKPKKALAEGQTRSDDTIILNSLSGIIRPARLTVILGPSGSGKTTLLTLMAGQKSPGCEIQGNLVVNQKNVLLNYLRSMAGFVHQEDVIMGTMTVKEAIRMSLCLRSQSEPSKEAQNARIEEVLEMLSLKKAQDTLIGTPLLKGVSGGEKKRVAIGMEIVANPPIIFLDECTSGLDTFSAFSVISALKKIAASGITVVATLHQPSSEIFELIDDLIIMAAGNIIYQGEAKSMVEYFSALGYDCPAYNNPPDFVFMKIIGKMNKERASALIDASRLSNSLIPKPDDLKNLLTEWSLSEKMKLCPSFSRQLRQLLKRNLQNLVRDPLVLYARVAQFLVVGLLTGITYNNMESSGSALDLAKNASGLMFFISTNMLIGGAITTMSMFSVEQIVFVREYMAGYYGIVSYFLSKILFEIPLQIFLPTVYCATAYWLIGFPSIFSKFVIFCCACSIINMCGTSIGMFVASCFKGLGVALAVLPVVLLPSILMGGVLVVNNVAPKIVTWIQWISPIQYIFGALCQNYLTGRQFETSTGELFNGDIALKLIGVSDRLDIYLNFTFAGLILLTTILLAFIALYLLAERSGGSPFLSYLAKRRLKKIAIQP